MHPQGSNTMALIERLLDGPPRLRTLKMRCAVDWSSKILTNLSCTTMVKPLPKPHLPIPNFSTHSRGCSLSEYSTFITSLFLHPRRNCPPNGRMLFICLSCKAYRPLVQHRLFVISFAISPSPSAPDSNQHSKSRRIPMLQFMQLVDAGGRF